MNHLNTWLNIWFRYLYLKYCFFEVFLYFSTLFFLIETIILFLAELEDTHKYHSTINWTVYTNSDDDYEWEDLTTMEMKREYRLVVLTPTLSAWRLRSHRTLKSILQETLFLDQLHDFSLLSLNSFLQPFLKSKIM